MPAERSATALPLRDWALAAALALAAGLLYTFTFQTRYFGDGPGLTSLHVLGGEQVYYHVLYLPACDLLQRVLGLADPFAAPRLLSILPAAGGVGLAYLVLRLFAVEARGALIGVLLLALSPALWFFATTVEVHALLFGCVAFVAAVTLLAPWELHPRLALALVALVFPLLYWAHQAAFILGPGWVLLVQYARARHGTRYSWPQLLLGVGPLLLASLSGAVLAAFFWRFGSLAPLWDEVREQFTLQSAQSSGLSGAESAWREEWLLPLGVLVPLALLGAARLREVPWRTAAIAGLTLFHLAFFLWWGVVENGGYFLSSIAFWLVPAALVFARPNAARVALALVLLLVQASHAHRRIAAYDQGWDPRARVERVREALGDEGLLLSTVDFAPDVRCTLRGIEQVSLTSFVRHACQRERALLAPERILAEAKPLLQRLLARHPRVALDLAYHRITPEESTSIAAFAPSLQALEGFLRERCEAREIADPYWPLLVLTRRP